MSPSVASRPRGSFGRHLGGVREPGAARPRPPETDFSPPAAGCRPAGCTALAHLPGRRRAASSVGGSHTLPSGRSVASLHLHRARARCRAGPEKVTSPPAGRPPRGTRSHRPYGGARLRQSEDLSHCQLASQPTHSARVGPRARGRAGPGSGGSLHHPTGRPLPALTTAVAVSPVDGRQRTSRCGVLTRIPVGAAAPAGLRRHPGPTDHGPGTLVG
jgi:hypothetical protein